MLDNERLQAELIDIRAVLFERIAAVNMQLVKTRSANVHELSQSAENNEHLEAALLAAQRELRQLNHALQRIYDKTYHLCEYCGANIDDERLGALPYTSMCNKCALHQ